MTAQQAIDIVKKINSDYDNLYAYPEEPDSDGAISAVIVQIVGGRNYRRLIERAAKACGVKVESYRPNRHTAVLV